MQCYTYTYFVIRVSFVKYTARIVKYKGKRKLLLLFFYTKINLFSA